MDQKRLLTRVLELERRRGNDDRVARTLRELANTNRMLCLCGEGIQQLKEALEIYERLGDAEGQGKCWNYLGWLLVNDEQLEAAEEALTLNQTPGPRQRILGLQISPASQSYISIQG